MSDKPVVLILEDLSNWQDTVQRLLNPDMYEVVIADSLPAAVTILHSRVIDAAVVDIRLEEGDITNTEGMAFLNELEKYYPEDRTHAIMLSGHGTIALAVEALTRPSRNVIAYFEKEKLYAEDDRFIAEVARAVRAAQAERTRRESMLVYLDLPTFFVEAISVSSLTASLAPEVNPLTAAKDLRLLLRNLLLNTLPLAREVRIDIESLASITGSIPHILCWSRKLVGALEVSIGRTGTLELLQPGIHWQGVGLTEKMSHWSTQYFDGIVFGLSGVSFEQFLSVAAPAS